MTMYVMAVALSLMQLMNRGPHLAKPARKNSRHENAPRVISSEKFKRPYTPRATTHSTNSQSRRR